VCLTAPLGSIKGLSLVDLNYPQHVSLGASSSAESGASGGPEGPLSVADAAAALAQAGLKCGAVCLRFPKAFRAGELFWPAMLFHMSST
jgi:hypothetical protein